MTRRRQALIVAAVALFAALAGAGAQLWRMAGDDTAPDRLWTLRLPDLSGHEQQIGQWRGKVLVVNFWATWCTPCREEIPQFVNLQARYAARGVQFVGIAIDQRDKVVAFAREFGMNYAVLLGGLDALDVSRQLGNRIGALPYTVVFDRGGRIVSRELGKAREAELEPLLQRLISLERRETSSY